MTRNQGYGYHAPGMYTYEETELTPFSSAARARICLPDQEYTEEQFQTWPMCQFICRGAETSEGAQRRHVTSFAGEQTWNYPSPEHVMWSELQVWIGVAVQNEDQRVSSYHVSPVRDRGRQVTRLIRREFQQTTPDRQRLDARWSTSEGGGSR